MSYDPASLDVRLCDAHAVVEAAWARGWNLPEPISVSEWADRNRHLTAEGSAEPGPWSTRRTPYLRRIMDCLSDEHPCKKVVLRKSTQVGGSEVLNNFMGYIVDHSPGPTMVVMPTEKLGQRWSKQRLAPMISASPALRGKIAPARSRDGGNTTMMKEFPGGLVVIAGSNSPSDLRSMPCRRILADEVDEYPEDLEDQGHPVDLAERRASTFVRRKIFECSSPKLKATSRISHDYEMGTQEAYHVPCPHCRTLQPLVIDQLTLDGNYLCQHGACGQLIGEHWKPWMLDEDNGATWIAGNPGGEHPSFGINALYAPVGLGYTWPEIAHMREEAHRNADKQVVFTNTILGLPFEGERQQADSDSIAARAEAGVHRGVVPRGGLIVTVAIDCQHDRFEAQVVAWGRGQRAYIVDYDVIAGDPSMPTGYGELDAWLHRTYVNRFGAHMLPRVVAIDGGNWTEQVAQFVRSKVARSGQARTLKAGNGYQRQHLYLVRGRSAKSERIVYRPAKTEVNKRERTIARSVGVWGVGTDVAKHILFGRMTADGQEDVAIEDRMIRFPGGKGEKWDPLRPDPGALSPDYYAGLTVEYYDLTAKRWICPKGARNEPIDTLVYNLWCALSPTIRIDMIREHEWVALEAALEPKSNDLFAPASDGDPDSRETTQPPAQMPGREGGTTTTTQPAHRLGRGMRHTGVK